MKFRESELKYQNAVELIKITNAKLLINKPDYSSLCREIQIFQAAKEI